MKIEELMSLNLFFKTKYHLYYNCFTRYDYVKLLNENKNILSEIL